MRMACTDPGAVRTASEMDFEQYVTERLPTMVLTARAICGDIQLADDLVQDVLLKLHQRWPTIGEVESVDAYSRRMLVNAFVSWRRKWGRIVPHEPPVANEHRARSPDPAERATLLAAVRRLPSRQRAAVGLRYFVELNDTEIADALGCTVNAVRVLASRGLATLRVQMTAERQSEMGDVR